MQQFSDSSYEKQGFDPETVSKFPAGALRFLACVIDHGLRTGMRTSEDFVRHFPPAKLMLGLRNNVKLRSTILQATTGIMRQIAEKKSVEAAGCDLQIALEEGVSDADTILRLLPPDERVKIFDPRDLWSFVVKREFWKGDKDSADQASARRHIRFILDRAIAEGLVTHEEIVGGMGIQNIVECLPKTQLTMIIQHALEMGQVKKFFRAEDLMSAVRPAILVAHIPPEIVWERIVLEKIAEVQGFVSSRSDSTPAKTTGPSSTFVAQKVTAAPALLAGPQASPVPKSESSAAPPAPAKQPSLAAQKLRQLQRDAAEQPAGETPSGSAEFGDWFEDSQDDTDLHADNAQSPVAV